MGVGKTLISLSKVDILKQKSVIRYTLVICPKSVMITWATEIKKHSNFTLTLLEGSLQNKIKLLSKDSDIYIISYDSIPGRKKTLGILLKALILKRFGFIICDEATHIKNFNAIRTKAVTQLCDIVNRTLFLSGTPITNSLENVITIYRAMDGGISFGTNYFAARNHFFANHGYAFPDWRLKKDREEEFKKRLFFNAIRLLKSECLDLPPKIFTERYTELEDIQKEIYRKIAEELLHDLTLPEGRVKIHNSLVKLAKLSQITNGFVYTDKNVQNFANNPKLTLLKNTLEELSDNKIIIFTRWSQDIENISKLLDNSNIGYSLLQGRTRDRGTPINTFINDPSTKVLLSQITVGAYSLTLTVSHTVIYYSLGFSTIEYSQSQDRIHRIGQVQPCIYISLLAHNTIDEYIHDSLKINIDIAKSLINEASIDRLKSNLNLIL